MYLVSSSVKLKRDLILCVRYHYYSTFGWAQSPVLDPYREPPYRIEWPHTGQLTHRDIEHSQLINVFEWDM